MEIIYTLFLIYASLSGMNNAILYGKRGAETFKWNEHMLFFIERGTVLGIGLYGSLFVKASIKECLILLTACVFAFSFYHNAFYYETTRQINRPDYRFWSNSKTSTAKVNMDFKYRFPLAIISIGLMMYNLIYNK